MLITDPASPDFNSYAGVAELRDFAKLRGLACPDEDDACVAVLIQAMDYLERQRWEGMRTDHLQPLCWPRANVAPEGTELDRQSIPRPVVTAQCRLALDSMDIDLTPSYGGGSEVVQESVSGAVSVTYATGTSTSEAAIPWIAGHLRGLLAAPNFVELERW